MEKHIYYHDSDAGGVVYYANYLKYMEEARVNLLNNCGFSESHVNGKPVFFPVRQCNITYHKPAFYGETIVCSAEIKKVSPAKLVFHQTVTHKETRELLAEADITLACVNASDFRPIRIPKNMREILSNK